jgi:hypothetical protein
MMISHKGAKKSTIFCVHLWFKLVYSLAVLATLREILAFPFPGQTPGVNELNTYPILCYVRDEEIS